MELSTDWILVILSTLVLGVVCKLVSKKLNKDVDTMFDGMADMRTQRFFFAFDGQPEPISITEAGRLLKENNGRLIVRGTYNQRPVSVTVETEEYLNRIEQDVTTGHSYVMPCTTSWKGLFSVEKEDKNDPKIIEELKSSLQPVEQDDQTISGVKVFSSNSELCGLFLGKEQVREYLDHLINSSNIDDIAITGEEIRLIDSNPDGGESFIRIRTIFEMQDYLARQLENP